MGCFEVVQSSLRATPRNAQPELYRRGHAQCVVLCNYFALRCIKRRRFAESIALLKKAPPPRTKWTRRVPHPVLIGHAASLTPY